MDMQNISNHTQVFEKHKNHAKSVILIMEQLQEKVEQLNKWDEEYKFVRKEVPRISLKELQYHKLSTTCCKDKAKRMERRAKILAQEHLEICKEVIEVKN